MKDKLWPEVYLFRERFGYLPEFPSKDGTEDEEAKPENTIKYWQDKLHDKEVEYRTLRTSFCRKTEEIAGLKKELEDRETSLSAAEAEHQETRREAARLASRVNELEEKFASVKNQLNDYETLVDEGKNRWRLGPLFVFSTQIGRLFA